MRELRLLTALVAIITPIPALAWNSKVIKVTATKSGEHREYK